MAFSPIFFQEGSNFLTYLFLIAIAQFLDLNPYLAGTTVTPT